MREQLRELPEDVLLYLHRAVSQQRLQRLLSRIKKKSAEEA